jgi:AcrR family transcriptional regulator
MPRTGWTTDELRSKALDAAERVIRLNGYDRSKLTDVARELGISHAALYKHFDSKEALLDAVTARWLARIDAGLTAVAKGPGSVSARLRDWFLTLHRLKREKIMADPELFRAFDSSTFKLSPAASSHLAYMHAQLGALIAEGIASGELQPGDPAQIAARLFEASLAFHHPRLVAERLDQDEARDREAQLGQLLDLLLAGLKAQS